VSIVMVRNVTPDLDPGISSDGSRSLNCTEFQ
jgi:hypothetical protein